MTRRFLLPLALTLGVPNSPLAAVQDAPVPPIRLLEPGVAQVVNKFRASLMTEVEMDAVGSITAGVVRGDKVIWTESFGWADRRDSLLATRTSLYRVGSISKTVTAVLMLQLVEQGVVDLDEPVVDYLPEIEDLDGAREAARSITLRQLASHTAGLAREPALPNAAAGPIDKWEDKILASIPTTRIEALPGSRYSYSNIGFGILGLALSRAAERSFMVMVEEMIFEPLGMDESRFVLTPSSWDHLAVGYAKRPDGSIDRRRPAREHWGRGYKVPNGGVYTTVDDLARFMGALSGGSSVRILSEQSRRALEAIQTPDGGPTDYGLGVFIRSDHGLRTIGHSGSVAGYNAYMSFDPKTTLGVILLRNYEGGRTNLREAAEGLLAELVRVEGGA